MEAVRVQQVVVKDGEVLVRGIPYKKGQVVEIIVLSHPPPNHSTFAFNCPSIAAIRTDWPVEGA